jgi:uncharacterized protein (UPF0332 family)
VTPAEFLERAERALESGKRELEAGDPEAAANRLYYAMFHAARAALLSIGQPADGKHGTIIGRFSREFCRDGPLAPELGRAFNEAARLRVRGDYGADVPATDDVAPHLLRAEQFVAAVKAIIPS